MITRIFECIKKPYEPDNTKIIFKLYNIVIFSGILYIIYLKHENNQLKSLTLNNIVPHFISKDYVQTFVKDFKNLYNNGFY